jgi:hypothetical protein
VYPTGGYTVDKTTASYQATAIGIISTNPIADGIIGNNVTSAHRQPIALAGRVPAKVSLMNGPIQAGDSLTASPIAGFAMKATASGTIIGKALEDYDGTQPRISALVTAEESDRAVAHATDLSHYQSNANFWPTDTAKIMVFVNVGYEQPTVDITNTLQGAELTVTGKAILGGDTTVSANLNVSGASILASLTVTGTTTLASLTVNGNAVFKGSITVNGHIITGGTTPTVAVQAAAGNPATCTVNGNDTSGVITVVVGTTQVTKGAQCKLTFVNAYGAVTNPVVTGRDENSAKVQPYIQSTATDFTVSFGTVPDAGQTYGFSYFVTQ